MGEVVTNVKLNTNLSLEQLLHLILLKDYLMINGALL
jgi:hypothetical protein